MKNFLNKSFTSIMSGSLKELEVALAGENPSNESISRDLDELSDRITVIEENKTDESNNPK
jgi:hypothetical protein